MKSLYVCNTSSDFISVIDLCEFKENNKIFLNKKSIDKIGPHGICKYEKYILTANNYSNDISVIDLQNHSSTENYYIGSHCNDVKVLNNIAYVICGDSNSLISFNLKDKRSLRQLKCGNLPHSIDIDKRKKIMVVASIENDSITLIDCEDDKFVKEVRVGAYPTKAIFSVDGNYIYVCESNIGLDCRGSLAIISLKNFEILTRIKLGNSPVDIYCDSRFCYASNFGDGSISVIDIINFREISVIRIGGMPRGIIRIGSKLYVGDNYNNSLMEIDVKSQNKKVIPIGGEPTGMTLD
ncbi:YncE family protein [Haloimpatiens sp. FM7315]|uniref:YncE family protein n=1 Tax=Haloimpatiens sp. FM7315 TaxID=3298609 RepID=UPI00370B42FE